MIRGVLTGKANADTHRPSHSRYWPSVATRPLTYVGSWCEDSTTLLARSSMKTETDSRKV
ncbi:hypothetical protein E2C01_012458 [Portunus trituberculatus]|uniref:Uncharacterized protein n=1 Tax=Portunus trituberculatus TaxID=210409 RepID=A0A5B7DE48_PORTR|nr:hypothetical protein [Portunus trituberculatus]